MPIRRQLPVCKVGEIPEGRTHSFRFGHASGIAYNDCGTIKAYVNRCTHMGGLVELCGEKTFRCRWHKAEFDACTGRVLCGEAPAGSLLAPIELLIEDDHVYAVLELPDDPFS